MLVTDHNRPVRFDDGSGFQDYTPQNGFDSSAATVESGLKEHNRDLMGVISDDRFTYDDLRGGVWDGAAVTASVVDWMYPHAGALVTRKYTIGRIVHTGESFTAELGGLTNRLRAKSGRVYSRVCDADLFDARCGLAASLDSDWETTNVPVDDDSQDATEPRRIFDVAIAGLPTGLAADFFKYGQVVWTLGENARAGIISICKSYTPPGSEHNIELYEPTPFAIANSDEFTMLVGCDKLFATCRDKFEYAGNPDAGNGNTANFRGVHLMPGSDHVLRTPNQTT